MPIELLILNSGRMTVYVNKFSNILIDVFGRKKYITLKIPGLFSLSKTNHPLVPLIVGWTFFHFMLYFVSEQERQEAHKD